MIGWFDSLSEWWTDLDETNSEDLAYEDFSTQDIAERETGEEGEEYHTLYLAKKYDSNDSEDDTRSNILLAKSSDGEVQFAKSKYLSMYLTADNAIYLIRNYNNTLWQRIKKIIGSDETENGSGLINFPHNEDINLNNYVRGASGLSLAEAETKILQRDRVSLSRENRLLRIKNIEDGWFKDTWFDYSLDGWASKYGVPLQLSLALHLSSLAPDFAYDVAEIGALDTRVDMGLLETDGNSVKMQLDIDLDEDGTSEKYTLETDTQMHIHKDNNSNIEEIGCSTIDEAINQTVQLGEAGNENISNQYENVEEAINKLEEKLAGKEGDNKILFGHFAYWVDKDQKEAKEEWNQALTNENGPGYVIDVNTSDELVEMIRILISQNLATVEHSGNGNTKFKVNNENEVNTARIKQLFLQHFKVGDIIEIAREISTYLGVTDAPDYSNWRQWDTSETQTHDELEDPSSHEIYFTSDGDNTYYVPGVQYSTRGGLLGYLPGDYDTFWQGSIENVWDWFFNGVELESNGSWYDFIYSIPKHFPIRTYYRLVDDSGNPVLFGGNSGSDYIYVDGGNTYWNDEDNKGWFWRRAIPLKLANAIKNKMGVALNDSTNEYISQILDKASEVETEEFVRYIPFILEVKNHWYRDITFEGCYEWDTSESAKMKTYLYTAENSDLPGVKKASQSNVLYIQETSKGKLKQIANAKEQGIAGEKIKYLIDNIEYYKYDGTGKSKEKSKINFADSSVDAIAMLEQIQGEDAQDIIRMFKELMAGYKIYFEETEGTAEKKELFEKVIANYSGDLLTQGDDCVYKASIPPTQEGFSEGLDILAPCNGLITYRKDDTICIEIDEPSKTYDKYTILISGFQVDESITANSPIQANTKLGKTIRQDLKLVLRDENGSIIKNKYNKVDRNES